MFPPLGPKNGSRTFTMTRPSLKAPNPDIVSPLHIQNFQLALDMLDMFPADWKQLDFAKFNSPFTPKRQGPDK